MDVLELGRFKESVTNFEIYFPFVKQILTSLTTKNTIILQDWKDMAKAILEPQKHLQWFLLWREEAKKIA
jgi:sensor domain CHASE-containing protein